MILHRLPLGSLTRTLLVHKPNDQYQDKNGNAYQYDFRIFCHQRIPEYLVQQLARTDYREAVRLLYLQTLKQLSDGKRKD